MDKFNFDAQIKMLTYCFYFGVFMFIAEIYFDDFLTLIGIEHASEREAPNMYFFLFFCFSFFGFQGILRGLKAIYERKN